MQSTAASMPIRNNGNREKGFIVAAEKAIQKLSVDK